MRKILPFYLKPNIVKLVLELFEKFERAGYLYNQIECWSARELQEIFVYTKWDNFLKIIDKAKTSYENAGKKISDHFADIGKMVELESGSKRKINNIALTRYASPYNGTKNQNRTCQSDKTSLMNNIYTLLSIRLAQP
ncbi:MAG: hypothetical protein JST58_18245 [Bacteroidetes bacterium]|nr:hypothetical protein [Bacteroidota bacterium]